MTDSPLPKTNDGRYDYPYRRGRISKKDKAPNNRLAVSLAVGSLILQLLGIAWMGGRLDERVTGHDRELDKQAQKIDAISRDIGQHAAILASANATYAEILRRLQAGDERDTRIERKIDELGRNRN